MLLNCAGEDFWASRRCPWTARRSNLSILKVIIPENSLEGLTLKLKLQYLWPPDTKNWLIGKDPDTGKDWGKQKGVTEDEMVGWHQHSQFNSVAHLCLTFWDLMDCSTHQASLSITNSRSLLNLMSLKLVMPSNLLILCHPLLLPSIFPSIRVFSNELALHIRWPKYRSFSFSISDGQGINK